MKKKIESGLLNRLLSSEEKRELANEIKLFSKWLEDIGIPLPGKPRYKTAWIRDEKREDWVMWVQDPGKKEVQFNSYIRSKCSFSYFVNVILHECFHLFAHDLPNKADAKRLRDDFGEEAMRVLDIEADFFVAEFLRHTKGYDLRRNLGTFYDGGRVFGDPKTRIGKLERFVGAILSISNAYFEKSEAGTRKLFLPTVKNILTENSLHVIIMNNHCSCIGEIDASIKDFRKLNLCYTKADTLTRKKYVATLVRFSKKALQKTTSQTLALAMSKETN
jgi:hypothetical protein